MDKQSRTYNSIMNSLFGIVASVLVTILNFVVRVVLVRELGEEINGLHNLFQSIINVMTLMELGISTAMIIHLYAPVKEGDELLIKGILNFYKKIYSWLSLIFTSVCLLVAFFLIDRIVTTTIPLTELRVYFILFALSFSVNYILYYKRSLLYAEQKNRVSIIVSTGCELLFRTIQIILIIVFHQYVLFLLVTICEKIACNSICNYYVDKRFPYLKHNKESLNKEKKVAIINTVKPLFVNQMANTVQLASRSILISILLGNVAIVGYFGNYQLILNVVQMIYGQFGGAITSSFGNLSVDNDADRMRIAYLKSSFVMNRIAIVCCACFVCVVQDFIYVVFGPNFVISLVCVFILTINLVVYLLDIPIISVQNAMGLHRLDAWHMVIQAVCAITLGYFLGKIWGMMGIFVGLMLPLIVFTFIRKGIVISRKAFGMCAKDYLSYIGKEFAIVLLIVTISFGATSIIHMSPSVSSIIVKFALSFVVSLLLIWLASYRNPFYHEAIHMIAKMIPFRH